MASSNVTATTTTLAANLPPTQTAVVGLSKGKYAIETSHRLPGLPLPPTHLLIRVSHVALNPHDWKAIEYSPVIGAVGGGDFSGEVIAVGSEVTRRQVGDCVCGTLYGLDPHVGEVEWGGAFAQYVSADETLVMTVVPRIGLAGSAGLGVGVITAGMALFRSLELAPIPDEEQEGGGGGGGKSEKDKSHVLIYGGSTATGTMAIQMAKLAGYLPIATCSPANFGLVQSYGAVKAFDYRSPSCGVAIRAFTKGKLRYALDCISDADSVKTCYAALGPRGSKYTALEPPLERRRGVRNDIQTDWVMALTIFGKAVDLEGEFRREAAPEDRLWATQWYPKVERLLARGALRPHPIRLRKGGWSDVLDGIEELKLGKVRGEKLVYEIGG